MGKKVKKESAREKRIDMKVVVDCCGA